MNENVIMKDININNEMVRNNTNSHEHEMQVDKDGRALQDVIMYDELATMDIQIDSDDEKMTRTLSDKMNWKKYWEMTARLQKRILSLT